MASQSLKVSVYGNELSLKADDPDRVIKAAAYVDGQMTLYHANAPDQATSTLAILTALNVAEETIGANESVRELRARVEGMASALEAATAG